MKFNKSWVDEWVANNLSAQELSDAITMAGLEVDTCEPVCGDFSQVVVASVVECWDHPDSDHLHVTKVDAGQGELLQIVCGAPNCRAGLKVACALVGAQVGDLKIKKAKLRGVESSGMLCSYRELGMSEDHNGIMELPEDAPIGVDLHEYMQLNDSTIDVDLTTNRPDCLSIRGIAREVAVLTHGTVKEPALTEVPATIADTFPVTVEDGTACPRYLGRVIRGVNQKAVSPLWMTEKLRRCGIRSVSPIVDVTNYVMLELGQPLHSFDLNRLHDGIVVRFAKEGETLVLLSGEKVDLTPNTLVIADSQGPLGLAGIFGGESSGINEETHDVFLEAAFFAPLAIKGRARHYGLKTDASHRFERGVDPQLQRRAMERATELLLQVGGGEAGPIVEVACESELKAEHHINLRLDRLAKVLGCAVPVSEVEHILATLGLNPVKTETGYTTTAPSFRFDLEIEEDLIEEVARIYGYNQIPNTLPMATMVMSAEKEEVLTARALRHSLVQSGYQEAITYSFTEPKALKVFSDQEPMVLANPISVEMSAMRTSLLAGLALAAKYNVNRQQKRVRLFELGLSYNPDEKAEFGVRQEPMIAGIAIGDAETESWAHPSRHVDFFDIKGDVEAMLALTARPEAYSWQVTTCPFLHPGQGADLYFEGRKVGCVGMLHPTAQKALGFKQQVAVFEIERAALATRIIPQSREISKFPAVRRDFAFVLDQKYHADELVAEIKNAGGALVSDVTIFDVFASESLGDKRSLALGVTLHDNSHTLEDAEVEAVVAKILEAVKIKFDATLRQ